MNSELVGAIKNFIDDNMMKQAEECAKKNGYSLEGWFRKTIWDAIKAEKGEKC